MNQFIYLFLIWQSDGAPLTRFRHGLNWNILFIGHEAKHGEDSEACHEAGAAVQAAQHDAVPYGRDGGKKREKRHHTYCKLLINPTPEATQTSMHMSCEERKLGGAKCAK